MVRVELHIDNSENPDMVLMWLGMLKQVLLDCKLVTEECIFTIEHNKSVIEESEKDDAFIRIVVTSEDRIGKTIQTIRRFLPEFDGLGIDIITMPMYVPPGTGWGRWSDSAGPSKPEWYDPSNPPYYLQNAKEEESAHG